MHTYLILIGDKFSALILVLVDMFYPIASQVESHTEIFRTKHIMQISYFCKLLGYQSTVERVQASDAVIFHLQVSLHEIYIRSKVIKQGSGVFATQHCNANIGVLVCQ